MRSSLNELGPISKDEKKVLVIFALAVLAWMTRSFLVNIEILSGLTDAGIAIIAAILLFMIPSSKDGDILKWEKSKDLPWGLLPIWGGLSLATN